MKVPGLILGLLLPWLAVAQTQYFGTRISNLTLSGTGSQSDLQVLPIRIGDTLTPQNLRLAIEALYNTGHYSYIEADAQPSPDGGTALEFRVRPFYFFSTFVLEPAGLLERSLSNYFRLPYGEKFASSAIDRVVQDTIDLLVEEGYFQAKVVPDYRFDDTTRLAYVTLKATAGQRARIGQIRFSGGEQTFTEEELADAFDLKTGKEFSGAKLDKALADVRAKFTKLRFLNTKVTADRRFDAATNTVDLDITVVPGQFALVQARGFEISDKKVQELVPIYEEAAVDPDLIEEGRVRITQFMQQEGFFEAMVEVELIEVDPSLGDAIQINYLITPGVKHEIKEVRIEGNYHISTDVIKERIKARRGVFSADILEEDRRLIEAMYRNAGFQDTVVRAITEDVDHVITVIIQIEEGQQLPIGEIVITGNNQLSEKELRSAMNLREGELFTPNLVDNARAALTQAYYSRGYADARVERTVERINDNGSIRVGFQITEGRSFLVGSILVAGNTITKDKVIRRDSRLQEYKPLNPEAVLEAQQRLYATGLFTRVEVVTLDEEISGLRNILIQVEDAKPILLTYGIGYQEFERVRGTFEISHNNLFGLRRTLAFRGRASTRERLASLTYHEPRLFNHELDGYATSFVEYTEQPFYSATRIDFALQVLKRISLQRNVVVTSSWQTVDIGDVAANPHAVNDPAQIGPCKICQIGRIGATYVTDRRDDALNPTKGSFQSTTMQVAGPFLASELQFTSFFNQYSYYFPFRSGVMASSFRFGWNHPFGKTAQLVPGQTQQLPATERYWAGGSTTLRGFGLDEANPPNNPTLEGGNAMIIGNLEYRFPLRTRIRDLDGALFYDTGNVFPHLNDVSLGQFTHSVGFGLRYRTPVGPARLDFGFNLRPTVRPDGTPEPRMKVFFTLGNPF